MVNIFFDWTNWDQQTYLSSDHKNDDIIVSLKDDGFLPDGVTSPYRYYVQGDNELPEESSPLFANLITLPDLWEVLMYYEHAEIWNDGILKANIEYTSPHDFHNVKTIQWKKPDGRIYKIDHYDQYGKLFYSELCALDESVNVQIYYSEEKPVLIVHPKFNTYTLMQDGTILYTFHSQTEFLHHYLDEAYPEEAYSVPDVFTKDILILTGSDQIEQLETLISRLPEFHFHIGAKTRMSDKLLNLTVYPNVSLYEGISEPQRNELLYNCTYYLDINHFPEICDAVYEARRHQLLIVGFRPTLHNRSIVLSDCKFNIDETDQMIRFLKWSSDHKGICRDLIMKQSLLHVNTISEGTDY